MPNLQVRNLPDSIYRRIVDLAEREHRSITQQTLTLIEHGLAAYDSARTRRKKTLELLKGASSGIDQSKLLDPIQLVREDRDR